MLSLVALNRSGKLYDTVKDWKEENIKKVCIIINVGKGQPGDTYLVDEKLEVNHWTCLLLDFLCGTFPYLGSSK